MALQCLLNNRILGFSVLTCYSSGPVLHPGPSFHQWTRLKADSFLDLRSYNNPNNFVGNFSTSYVYRIFKLYVNNRNRLNSITPYGFLKCSTSLALPQMIMTYISNINSNNFRNLIQLLINIIYLFNNIYYYFSNLLLMYQYCI